MGSSRALSTGIIGISEKVAEFLAIRVKKVIGHPKEVKKIGRARGN